MNKLNYLILIILMLFLGIEVSKAASFTILTDASIVDVGDIVTITVTANEGDAWEYCLDYDTTAFKLVSANSDTLKECVRTGSILADFKKVEYKLRAKKSGDFNITLKDYGIYNYLGEKINVNNVSLKLKVNEGHLMGDLNEDGVIGLPDVLIALKLYFGSLVKNDKYLEFGDFNDNGEIDLPDVLKILKLYFEF